MVEPKLPKLKKLRNNPTNGKILVRLNGSEMIQVDPEFFGFYIVRNGSAKSTYLAVNHEHTKKRFARKIHVIDEFREETLRDLMAMHKYSKKYQKWLNYKIPARTAIIKCGKEAKNELS